MSYEFQARENTVIRRTGKRTKLWGTMTLGAGALIAFIGVGAALTGGEFGVAAGVVYLLLALIPIFIGRNFRRAGNALIAVVNTEGNDIDHLMNSMDGLGRAFLIQAAAAALWAMLMLAGIALAIAVPELGA
jgi:hypothetical protein